MKMLALGIVLGVLIALGGAVFAHRDAPPPAATQSVVVSASKAPLSATDSAQIAEVYERVQREYVDKVEGPRLIDDALRGLHGPGARTQPRPCAPGARSPPSVSPRPWSACRTASQAA